MGQRSGWEWDVWDGYVAELQEALSALDEDGFEIFQIRIAEPRRETIGFDAGELLEVAYIVARRAFGTCQGSDACSERAYDRRREDVPFWFCDAHLAAYREQQASNKRWNEAQAERRAEEAVSTGAALARHCAEGERVLADWYERGHCDPFAEPVDVVAR